MTNPGPGDLNLSNVTVTFANSVGTAWVPTGNCLFTDYTATLSTVPAYGVMSAGETLSGVVTVTLANTAANQDDCQGQVVPLWIVAS